MTFLIICFIEESGVFSEKRLRTKNKRKNSAKTLNFFLVCDIIILEEVNKRNHDKK